TPQPATPTGSAVPAGAAGDADPEAAHRPSEVIAGVGVGFPRSEAGAVGAAVSYATAPQSWLYLSDEDVTAGVESIAAPEAQAELAGQAVQDVRLLRTELERSTGTVWYVVSPLATRV